MYHCVFVLSRRHEKTPPFAFTLFRRKKNTLRESCHLWCHKKILMPLTTPTVCVCVAMCRDVHIFPIKSVSLCCVSMALKSVLAYLCLKHFSNMGKSGKSCWPFGFKKQKKQKTNTFVCLCVLLNGTPVQGWKASPSFNLRVPSEA